MVTRSGDEIAAGDLDGDGSAELVRGASSPSGIGAGQFQIIDQQGLLRDPADFGFTGLNALNQFSYAFGDKVAIGDVNGDGIGDIIIGEQSGMTVGGELFALTKAGSPSIDSNVLGNLGFTRLTAGSRRCWLVGSGCRSRRCRRRGRVRAQPGVG